MINIYIVNYILILELQKIIQEEKKMILFKNYLLEKNREKILVK